MCTGCHKQSFTENALHITVSGLYVPKNAIFSVSRMYHFCVDLSCISCNPPSSNLKTPPKAVEIG